MRIALFILLVWHSPVMQAQEPDTADYNMQRIEVTARSSRYNFRLPAQESIIDRQAIEKQPPYSLVAAMNSVPGVRMEERSPGSYRLSIRGSLLRSPFGVRNVKIYLGEFPFTDAGGNTYLNSLDISELNSLRILKGPDASIYGANTGGVLIIDPVTKTPDSVRLSLMASAGSYGLFLHHFHYQERSGKSLFTISQSSFQSGGYRDHSSMKRQYFQISEQWQYSEKAQLNVMFLFSDLFYETPGGLTLQQFRFDPSQARPATPTLPGASEQKASVSNKTMFGGVSNTYKITENLKHVISVFGSHTGFANPFITNYEQRLEYGFGTRTYLDYSHSLANNTELHLNVGGEWQENHAQIENYGNRLGEKDTLQAADNIRARQGFVFARALADIRKRLLMEGSFSYNFFNYRYSGHRPQPGSEGLRRFTPQLMPRLGISYQVVRGLLWRASLSSGYSSPTIAEVRASDNVINTSLQAEIARNAETGVRVRSFSDNIYVDVTVFAYRLRNAIVRRLDSSGREFFRNAGGTVQNGCEAELYFRALKPRSSGFLRSALLKANLTYYRFRFGEYISGNDDYSGNKLTGVPEYTTVESVALDFDKDVSLFMQYYYSAGIPLDDANTAYARAYHLLQMKASWKHRFGSLGLQVFLGVDNVLNQVYSLGNDLNAVGGRYYNAAAPRNFYGGLKVSF